MMRILLAAAAAIVAVGGFAVCIYQGRVPEALGILFAGSYYGVAVAWPWGGE